MSTHYVVMFREKGGRAEYMTPSGWKHELTEAMKFESRSAAALHARSNGARVMSVNYRPELHEHNPSRSR